MSAAGGHAVPALEQPADDPLRHQVLQLLTQEDWDQCLSQLQQAHGQAGKQQDGAALQSSWVNTRYGPFALFRCPATCNPFC